jgi:hypothetical protein
LDDNDNEVADMFDVMYRHSVGACMRMLFAFPLVANVMFDNVSVVSVPIVTTELPAGGAE